jgi:hypothetical protein
MPWRFVNQGPDHVCGTYFQTAYSLMILSIKVAVSSCRSDLCNERHVSGWLIHVFCECVSLCAATVECGPRPSLVWVQFDTTLWTGPVLRHLLTQDNTNGKFAGINWCLEWDSNPRSQCICGRIQLGYITPSYLWVHKTMQCWITGLHGDWILTAVTFPRTSITVNRQCIHVYR